MAGGTDTGLIELSEADVARHRDTAQALVSRFSILEDSTPKGQTELGLTRGRFVSTVSVGDTRRAREVTFDKTVAAAGGGDPLLTPRQHAVLYRTRRAIAVGLAIADEFGVATGHDERKKANARAALQGADAEAFHAGQHASAYVAAFAASAYLAQTLDGDPDPSAPEWAEPNFVFDTPLDALKTLVAGLDGALAGAKDDVQLQQRALAFAKQALDALLQRRGRFAALAPFENAQIGLPGDDFTLSGFSTVPGVRRKPLVMTFKKPGELIGNHIAKQQAMRLAKMIVAHDFARGLNPFVELGGFIFTFIGDGAPGTGKTTLIQMMAGLIKGYCDVAGYPFVYQNFGADQISSYQGKSGQNCKAFIDAVLDPNAIGFGTIDDVDQVAAKRSDDRASAGQHEITAVLMEAFSGASTVVRGNATFGMFSNYPENVDDALRQRAGARFLVDGPQTLEDYVDIFVLLAGKNHKIPLGDHDLYAAQALQKAVSEAYDSHDRPHEAGLAAVYERHVSDHGEPQTLAEIGAYLHAIKLREPRFTGRAIKNITDAVKMRAMDIELPDEWFETPEPFLHKSYDDKLAMISELRKPFTVRMVMQEINRYADSEFRYSATSDKAAMERIVRDARLREMAIAEIERLKAEGKWGV